MTLSSLPLLPSSESVDVFAQLRKAPRLDLNEARQMAQLGRMRELHATRPEVVDGPGEHPNGRKDTGPSTRADRSTFGTPTRASITRGPIQSPFRTGFSANGFGRAKDAGDSPHQEFSLDHLQSRKSLPCFSPRIAFRDVTRATDTRTVRVSLLPPRVFVTNKAPYFLWPRGDERDQAFLLGVLSSIPLDWYARRFVEISMNYFVLNPFPIPPPDPRGSPLESNRSARREVGLAGLEGTPLGQGRSGSAAVVWRKTRNKT